MENNEIQQLKKEIEQSKKELEELKSIFYRNKFSNLEVFDKRVQMRSAFIFNVLTTTPTHTGVNGETYLVSDGVTTKKICSWLNSTWQLQDYT